jgi:TonB family protein
MEFEKPALDAIRQWRFEPGIKNGVRVAVNMELPITFNLNN